MKSEQIIEKIRNKFKDVDPAKRSVLAIIQFHFNDNDGNLLKHMVFDFKNLNIYEGTVDNPDAEITISDDDFFAVGTKEITFEQLIENKKVDVKGDREAIKHMVEKFRIYATKV